MMLNMTLERPTRNIPVEPADVKEGRVILVTGSSGFIGRWVCAELQQRGMVARRFDLPAADITDPTVLATALLANGGVDGVIHCAGLLGTHELFDQLDAAIRVNVGGMANLVRGITTVQERWGKSPPLVVIDQPHIWVNPYETTKEAAVKIARAYSAEYRFPLARVVTYNAFGVGQKHGPGHPQKIIPTFASNAWHGQPIPVWGDGQQRVDLVWVGDVAASLVDALDAGPGFREWHVGTGVGFTVEAVARVVADHVAWLKGEPPGMGRQGLEFLPMRRGETRVPDDRYVSPLASVPFRIEELLATVEAYRPVEHGS